MTLTYLPVIPAGTLNGAARPNPIQAAAAYATLRVIYGTPRVPAQIANVIDYGTSWVIQVIWGEGQIQGVSGVLFNDENPPASTTATHYLGTPSQTVNATLVAAFAAKGVTFTDNLNGIAYSVFTVVASSVSGMPAISALVAGRLVYDPRENLLTYSEQLDNSVWWKGSCTITPNSTIAPDGALTGDLCTVISTVASTTTVDVVATSTTNTLSLYVKAGTKPFITLLLRNATTGFEFAYCNFVFANPSVSGGAGWTVTAAPNGWYRLSFSQSTEVAIGNVLNVYWGLTGGTYAIGESWHVWGAQLAQTVFTYGSELFVNGNFDNGTVGWTLGGGAGSSFSVVAGRLSCVSATASNVLAGQAITTVVGKVYTITFDNVNGNQVGVYRGVAVGDLSQGSSAFSYIVNHRYVFTASTTTTWLTIMGPGANSPALLDNVSVRESTPSLLPYVATTSAAVVPVTAYSDNPALCAADFATNNVYGMGMTVDTNSTITAALLCDALVVSAKRRRLSLMLDQAQDANVWLDILAAYAGCWATTEGTNVVLIPDRPASVSKAFSHASGNILEISNLKRRGVAGLPTAVEVRYTDTTVTPWREASQWAYLPGVVAGTYPRRESQVMMLGIQTASQALREATERLNKLTLADLSCSLKVFDEGLALVQGDVVSVTHPIGLTAKEFRVQSIDSELGRHTLALLEYDPAVYSDLVVAEPTTPDTLLPSPHDATVAPATGLNVVEEIYFTGDGTMATRLRATWTPATDLWEISHRITFTRMTSAGGATPVVVATGYSSTGTYAQAPLEDGYWYQVAVVVERLRTTKVSTDAVFVIQALGKLLPPSNVASLTATPTQTGAVLGWPAVIDLDMKGYRVKSGSWGGTLVLDTTATSENIGYASVGTNTYVIKALDWSGNESAAVATAVLIVPPVPPVTALAATVSEGDILLTWTGSSPMWPLDRYEVRYGGTAWGVGDTYLAAPTSTALRALSFAAGSRTYRVAAFDVAGNISSIESIAVTITAPGAVNGLRVEVVDNNALIYWSAPSTGNLPVDRYEARKGASWETGSVIGSNGNSTFTTVFEQLAGMYTYWVVAVDSFGNAGPATSVVAAISQPPDYLLRANIDTDFNGRNFEFNANGAAEGWSLTGGTTTVVGGAITLTSTGVDPMLIASLSGEFFNGCERPKALVKIKRIAGAGTDCQLYYSTAGHGDTTLYYKTAPGGLPAIGSTVVLEFDMTALTAGGTDWVDNRILGLRFDFGNTAADIFEIDYIRFVSYTGTNILLEDNNTLLLPVNTTETWTQHFVNNAWTSPQAQVTAGYPLYAEPSMASSVYTQELDYGSVLPSTNISATLNTTAVAGSMSSVVCQISYRLTTGAAWTVATAGEQALASNFRYVRVVYTFTAAAGGTNLLRVNALNIKLSIKQRSDGGVGTAAIGGTAVLFNYPFISADLPAVQPGGSTPLIPVVIYVGGANPTGFTVKLYNLAGDDVGGTFSWNVKGY